MITERVTQVVLAVLGDIAPEANLDALDRNEELRDELDIDSMDFLNFVTQVGGKLGLDVPEIDYPKIATFDACVTYLVSRLEKRK